MVKHSGYEPWPCESHNCHLQAQLYFAAKLNYIITNFKNKVKVMANANTFNFHLHYTGRFIMFSVITNIYNKKTKGPTLMELFTATGKLKKSFF
jgi:hypothetical protein